MITLLNTSIITAHGTFIYEPMSLTIVQELVRPVPCQCNGVPCLYCGGAGEFKKFQSAIGHESTAEILTELLGVHVPVHRINFIQEPDSKAIVFKLKTRVPEGVVLSKEQIEEIGYEFGLLSRIS